MARRNDPAVFKQLALWLYGFLMAGLIGSFGTAAAQNSGKLSGRTLNAEDGNPLEFVNIAVFVAADSGNGRLAGGGITDELGRFSVDRLPLNRPLYIRASSMGFQEYKSDAFQLTTARPTRKLEDIILTSTAIALNSVEIKGQKRMIEYALDKKVVNVEQSLVSEGGTATDVLQNVPSVTVDEDGNVSLKGSDNVTILIDGRPAVLSGLGLDQISAGSIESIEIISNPSAKYNPEGMAGILNIRTKKRMNHDLNGVVNVSTATSNQHSASTNLSFGLGKVTLFTSADLNFRERLSQGSTSTRSLKNSAFPELFPDDNMEWETGENRSRRRGLGGQVKVGADWRISDKDLFTVSLGGGLWYNNRRNETPGTRSASYFDSTDDLRRGTADDGLDYHWYETLSNVSNGKNRWAQFNTALSYRHEFGRKDQELTIDVSIDYNNPNNRTTMNRTVTDELAERTSESVQTTLSHGNGVDFDGQINYAHPFGERFKLEVGYQGKVRYNRSNDREDFRLYTFQDTAVDFGYTEQNHGIYANFGGSVGNFSFQVGGRMEAAAMDAQTVSERNDTTFRYFVPRFYPAVHLSYKIGKMQEIQLSYTRRVNRPRPWNLNPFVNYDNYPSSISMGNPDLEPEDIHSVELNYSLFYKGSSFFVTVYYRRVEDVIRRYTYEREDGVRVQTFLNYTSGTNYGFDLSYEQRVFSWWRFSLNGSLYQNITRGSADPSLNSEGLSYQLRFNTTFSFKHDLNLQLSCRYRGPNYFGQTYMAPNFSAELAARKGFFKNRFTVGLRVSDLFHTMRFNNTVTGSNFVTENRRRPLRSTAAYLTLSYKINQGLKRSQRPAQRPDIEAGGMEEM
ncbi:MAG: TonB-dependent receptor [Bacteroidales bacterium]|nr:TonB-dependent receptor [Bacteroidales bacterium]